MSLLEPAGERTVRQELGQAGRRAVPVFVAIGVVVVLLGLLITKVLETTAFADADAGVNRWFAKHRGSTLNSPTHIGTLITVVGLLIPIMVATCRMYRGMHYPTDTTTSYLFALALLAVAFRALPLGEGSRDRVPEGRRAASLRSG